MTPKNTTPNPWDNTGNLFNSYPEEKITHEKNQKEELD